MIKWLLVEQNLIAKGQQALETAQLVVDQDYTVAEAEKAMGVSKSAMDRNPRAKETDR